MALVIFDVDGTLFETDKYLFDTINSAFEEMGLERRSEEFITSLIGYKSEEFMRRLIPQDVDAEEYLRLFTKHKETYLRPGLLFPGTEEMLKTLKQNGHKLAVCSNGGGIHIRNVLKVQGIMDLFDAVMTGDEFTTKADAIRQLMERYGEDKTFMVGDRDIDFIGAKEAGVPSICVDYGYGRDDEKLLSTHVAKEAMDIVGIVEGQPGAV